MDRVLAHLPNGLAKLLTRNPKRLWPIPLAGFFVLSYIAYLLLGRSAPHLTSQHHSPPENPYSTSPLYNLTTTPIVLVSAFFPLPNSKHSPEDYAAWLKYFFSQVTTPIVVYTTPDFSPTVQRLRGDLPLTIDTTFGSPFAVPPLNGLETIYADQHDRLDPERNRHNPGLYATWNAKAWLLQHAAEKYTTNNTEWLFWCDAGALRDSHTFAHWPDLERTRNIFSAAAARTGTPADELFFIPMWGAPSTPATIKKAREWKEDDGPLDLYLMGKGQDLSEGSMFGGKRPAVKWWSSTFYALHDKYLKAGKFVGKDQEIFNSIMFLHPEKIVTVWPRDPLKRLDPSFAAFTDIPSRKCTWPRWYYYFYWLANEAETKMMRQHMAAEYETFPWWQRTLAWFGFEVARAGRGQCDVMREWSFKDILRESTRML
ncbi:hypothetical protein M407DRAFT_76493 [Tulasnella calospora MUT 4182]|uniref:Uncharacterized protein n=1 Tax=Tulasnella calospora MUT 4182 TaxID=1051891 RepID=A0A0C3LTV6_9AGAM|nr:hypothetical protein M407DRAFT_76493 [Tulasnella calospora MUT 4182]